MRLFYLIAATLLISVISEAQVEFNFFGGSQVTKASYKVNDFKQNTSYKIGFQAGIGLKVPFENKLYFAPSLFYSLKGYKVHLNKYVFPPDPDASDNNVTLHTVEIAPLLQFDLGNSPDHYFLGFGPSLDIQLYGKEKFNLLTGGTVKKNMRFSYGDYGHYSMSFIGRFGYKKSDGMFIMAQYNMGIASINNADNGPIILHRVFGISLGKYFN